MAKIRTGFVSNSSSSSFILDLRDKDSNDFVDFLKRFIDKRESNISFYQGEELLRMFDWINDKEDPDYEKIKDIPLESLIAIKGDNSFMWNLNIPNVIYGD